MQTNFEERCKFIPLRLTLKERKFLRLMESSVYVSNYTDKVDSFHLNGKSKRIHEQLNDICAVLSSLVVAYDYNLGQKLVVNKNFTDYEDFFQTMFEFARRYKIMNPGTFVMVVNIKLTMSRTNAFRIWETHLPFDGCTKSKN